MIPGSSFFGFQTGAIDDAAQEAIRNFGEDAVNNISIGPLEKLYGANNENVTNRIKSILQKRLNNSPSAQRLIEAGGQPFAGGNIADFGETRASLNARAVAQEKRQAEETRLRLRDEKKTDNELLLNNQLALGRQTIEANAAEGALNRAMQNDQFAFTSRENNALRAHEASERAKDRSLDRDLANISNDTQMQMAFIERDIANKQRDFDRETRRMDRRDANIAMLMQGLGQLGGAFSL